MQGSKDSRATTSCSECQRRKQKCSREWPCNHCQARKVPHLCEFVQKRLDSKTTSTSTSSGETRGQKRQAPESSIGEPALSQDSSEEGVEDGLKAWGYMPGHVHYMLASVEDDVRRPSPSTSSEQSSEVEKILHAIPPRSITDTFVNHFLKVVNYRYNTIYAPTFTGNYVQWWTDRASGKRLSPEFTCLLLRILAYTVQYLTARMRKMIEFELACGSQQLTERFANAAEQLSLTFSAANSCLERVQEQFLKGVWLKSESQIVESWHALGSTIREAQELGIDKGTGTEGLSQFEIEIRKRIWILLYIWDWQMSAWLGRPHLINQKECTFDFPSLKLDEGAPETKLLSPFAHMCLQAMLGRRLGQHLENVQSVSDLTPEQIFAIEKECEDFIDELPSVFKIKDPYLELDGEHPYYVFQRSQLHVVIYTTQLDFLKPFLTRSPKDQKSSHENELRTMGVDMSLQLLNVSRKLFDHEFPINAKFHLVVFCIFDTATILCSAIIHDVDKTLPRREEVLDAIDQSLTMLHQLSLTTKIGASSYNFLSKLIQASPILSGHGPIRKRQRIKTSDTTAAEPYVPVLARVVADDTPLMETLSTATFTAMDPVPQEPTTDDLSFDLDQFLMQNPFGDEAHPDMGGLEQIWHWENLELDQGWQQDPNVSEHS